MGSHKCCIERCPCNSGNCTLFRFPQNKEFREIWSKLTQPYTQSSAQCRAICKHHFEQKYIQYNKRNCKAIPTLFTQEEIVSKSPRTQIYIDVAVLDSDSVPLNHNYSDEQVAVYHDHSYMKRKKYELIQQTTSDMERISKSGPTAAHNPECSTTQDTDQDIHCNNDDFRESPPVQSPNTGTCLSTPKLNNRQRMIRQINKLHYTCSKIMKFNGDKRIQKIRELCESKVLASVIDSMSPAAQTFFHMQLNQAEKHTKRRRFTADDKIFGLSLLRQNPKAYQFLRKLSVLPSKAALNHFANTTNICAGIDKEMLRTLSRLTKDWTSNDKLCCVVFDEVALTPRLTFVESEEKIDGFVQFGKERALKICDHALVVMIRGLCGPWMQPVAYYLSEGSTPALTLKNILRNVVDALTQVGLIPKVLICDQGATTRACLRSFDNDARMKMLINDSYHIDNKILIGKQKLYIIYNPWHLMRGIRNHFLDKDLLFEGKTAKWSDIVYVYNEDCALGNIRLLKELTEEHVIPAKIKKIKTNNWTEVFNERTISMLQLISRCATRADGTQVSSTIRNTAEALSFFDLLFDSVNGTRNGCATGKMGGPVKDEQCLSKLVEFWSSSISTLDNMAFVNSNGTYVQVLSIRNWIATVKSLIELWSYLKKSNAKLLYTQNLNQEPLENFFSRIRDLNYRNISPDCFTFQTAYKSFLLSQSLSSEHDTAETLFGTPNNTNTAYIDTYIDIGMPIPQQYAFTAGYVSRRLLSKYKCERCKDIFLTSDLTEIHSLISLRERAELRSCVFYPKCRFILLLRGLIAIINSYLNSRPHNQPIIQHLRAIILRNCDTVWFGCEEHHKETLNFFIMLICRVQINIWCNSINRILRGDGIRRLISGVMTPLQTLALNKYLHGRKSKVILTNSQN